MAKYSLAQIKGAYVQKKDWEWQFPVSYYLFRPISFYLTYLVIRITDSPSCVAWVGFFIGLLGCLSFLFIPHLTIWLGIILLIIFAILDAVDGNIARVSKNVTYYGKFLDGILGVVIEGSFCFWLGLGLYLNPIDLHGLGSLGSGDEGKLLVFLSGVIIMCGRLYSAIFQGSYYANLIRKNQNNVISEGSITDAFKSSTYRKYRWYLLFINLNAFNLQLIILALCAALKIVDLFLFFFAIYYLFRLLATMVFYIYRAQKNLY